jgi:hypothetical protein
MMVPQVMIPITGKVGTAELATVKTGLYFPDQVIAIAQCPVSQGDLLVVSL